MKNKGNILNCNFWTPGIEKPPALSKGCQILYVEKTFNKENVIQPYSTLMCYSWRKNKSSFSFPSIVTNIAPCMIEKALFPSFS